MDTANFASLLSSVESNVNVVNVKLKSFLGAGPFATASPWSIISFVLYKFADASYGIIP